MHVGGDRQPTLLFGLEINNAPADVLYAGEGDDEVVGVVSTSIALLR